MKRCDEQACGCSFLGELVLTVTVLAIAVGCFVAAAIILATA